MKISKIPGLGRFGIFIDDVDLQTISDEEWTEIGQLHLQNLVTIIRDSNCTKEQQLELVSKWGDQRYSIKAVLIKKYKLSWKEIVYLAMEKDPLIDDADQIAVHGLIGTQEKTATGKDITRVCGGFNEDGTPKGMFAEGELLWHSNESGTLTFTPGVALLAHSNVVGSATGFVTTVDYYESVSEAFRSELNDMILIHKFHPGKINPGLNDAGQDAIMHLNMCPIENEVPMVIRSPGGLTGLHYSINTVDSIKGAGKKESRDLLDRIERELFVDNYIYDHWYQNNGDLCLFDNTITLHRRLGNIQDRLCYRIAHDYTNLQAGVYQPYFQSSFQRRYNREIRYIAKNLDLNNFRLPHKRLIDYVLP